MEAFASRRTYERRLPMGTMQCLFSALLFLFLCSISNKSYADFVIASANSSLTIKTNRDEQAGSLPPMEWVVDGRVLPVLNAEPFGAFLLEHGHPSGHSSGIPLPTTPEQAFLTAGPSGFFSFKLDDSQGHATGEWSNPFVSISSQSIYGVVGGQPGSHISRIFQWLILDYATSELDDLSSFIGGTTDIINFDANADLSGLLISRQTTFFSAEPLPGGARVFFAGELIIGPAETTVPEPSALALTLLGLLLTIRRTQRHGTKQ
jgi:hypothetical protein